MTRRKLLAGCTALPVVRALDWVKVTLRVGGGPVVMRWMPRAVAEARFRAVFSFIADMGHNRH